MQKNKVSNTQEKILTLECERNKKDVFDGMVALIKEDIIATFIREDDTSLLMRLVGGQQFRLTLKQVFVDV